MHCPQFITIAIAVTLAPLSIPTTSYAEAHTKGREVDPLTPTLKPGDYVWHPEVAPAGPVIILVSLPDQLLICLPQWCAHRTIDGKHRQARQEHPDRRVYSFAEEGPPRIEHL
jgi:hypothetical protein